MSDAWRVYVLLSDRTKRTYVGIAKDTERRLRQHNGELSGGAKATRAGRPWRVLAEHGPFDGRSEAQAAEAVVKKRRGVARAEPLQAVDPPRAAEA